MLNQADSVPQEEIKERGLEKKPHARRSEPPTFLLCTPQMGMFATIANLPRHARLPSVRSCERSRLGAADEGGEARTPLLITRGAVGAFPAMTGKGGEMVVDYPAWASGDEDLPTIRCRQRPTAARESCLELDSRRRSPMDGMGKSKHSPF